MRKHYLFFFSMLALYVPGQSNTATTSGSIGKCAVWDYPYTLYNNASASQTVKNGVTVTVDQDRNIGAVNFTGSGALNLSGTNGITLSGSGADTTCRWDIGGFSTHILLNNNGIFTNNSKGEPSISYDSGAFFTAPYAGTYRWSLGTGWTANAYGSYKNGSLGVRKQGDDYFDKLFFQNEAGTCGQYPGTTAYPGTWFPSLSGNLNLTSGQSISYAGNTVYQTGSSCQVTQFYFVVGTATMFYEN